MDTFWTLLKESVIMQGTITLALLGTCIYMWATGQPVPEELSGMTLLAVGFFFGSKYQNTLNRSSGGA